VLKFLNEEEELKEDMKEIDPEFLFNYYRVRLAETMEKAKELADKKNYAEAAKILSELKKEILESYHATYDKI